MRLRFIGLGDVGEQAMESCCRYLQQRGLNRFVERRLILKTTTGQFSLAAVALNGLAGIGRHTPQERLEVRRALGYVFFGGEIRDDAVAIRARHIFKPDRAPDEERSALRRLQSVLKGMGGRAEENFGRIFNNHLKNQCAAIAGQSDWLAADDLLVPDQPLLNPALCPQKGVIGRELGEAFLQDHRRRWRLLDGLGQSGSRLDVVVVAFPLNNSFGGEGAEVLAKAIRRVLDYPEANRIVAILGYGLYDATSTLAGKYLGPYMRALHHLNGFDGLMARPNSADAGMQLGRVLASIALSSDPETIQIDNPDSNQIQRDFGRRLVSFGYAEAPAEGGPPAAPDAGGPLIALYHTALADWIGNHCLNLNGHPMQTALMNRWAENPPSWPANAPPRWAQIMHHPENAGQLERETACKVVAYVGGGDALPGAALQALRARIDQDFPRARTVIYKFGLPGVPQPARAPSLLRRIFRPPPAEPTQEPLHLHLSLFVVDSFETRAVDQFREFMRSGFSARLDENTVLDPIQADLPYVQMRMDNLFADLLSQSTARSGVLGGLNKAAFDGFVKRVQADTPGEFIDHTALRAEAEAVSITVRRVVVSLLKEEGDRRTPEWLADVLAGLSWLCHEEVERRQVGSTFGNLLT